MNLSTPDGQPAPSCSSLAAIAQEAGVSRMTVSRVLRNAGHIAAETRHRVLAAVQKLGYRPNPLVSALMTQIHNGKLPQLDNVIAYLTSSAAPGGWRSHDTYRQFFEGATARAFHRGYRIEEFWLGETGVSPARLSRALYTRGIRGVVVGPMVSAHGHLNLKWSQFSAAAIGYSLLRPALDRVTNDQYNSALIALRELRRLGYRRIGMAFQERMAARVHYRWPAAFLTHQWRHGPRDPALMYLPGEWQQEGFCAWVNQTRPDAVLTFEPAVYSWLRDMGRRVPEDVALAHLDWSHREPFWAGVDQRSTAVGSAAVDLVIERINNNEMGVPDYARIVGLAGKWVTGSTVRPSAKKEQAVGRLEVAGVGVGVGVLG